MGETTVGYVHPEVLVDGEWLQAHANDPGVRTIESNEDILLYDTGHIPGAVHIDWRADLNDPVQRDYISPQAFAALCSRHGITPETVCVFYGDKSNWWACYALWVFQLFGHEKVRILNGGRDKWIKDGRPLTKEKPAYPKSSYPVPPLVDVRSPGEFSGEITHMPEYPQEGVLRGGHIPGAKSVPWKTACQEDGTFKSAEDLRRIYTVEKGVKPEEDTIVYCRIGERSSHTWFVLHYLLGYPRVRNYDGSWTEWGNRVRAPIERS
jgi:thiosulfate/3-mercaptopyruvate sulfurtransferase